VLLEVARDKEALRALTRQWFERSEALTAIREALRMGVPVLVTTTTAPSTATGPATVFAKRDTTQNLRYKFGADLRAEDRRCAFSVKDERVCASPRGRRPPTTWSRWRTSSSSIPTKLRQYQARYRGSFLHGGISPEEMILPVALLTPR
jgi:hypothetical protein